jgi:hypothetical protein
MAKLKYMFLCLLFLFACDQRLNNDFFKSLLELPNARVKIICSNSDIFDNGKGYRWEVYKLSDETYNEFIKKFKIGDTITAPHKNYYSKGDSILAWRRTPIISKDTIIFNKRFTDYNLKYAKCFSQNYFFNLLKTKGNFYSAYYYHYVNAEVEIFQWFIINSKTKEIYVESVHL